MGWGSVPRPGRPYLGKKPVPILQEAGWAPGPVWTGEKSRPHRDSIPDRPARSQSLYRLSYRAHHVMSRLQNFFCLIFFTEFLHLLLNCTFLCVDNLALITYRNSLILRIMKGENIVKEIKQYQKKVASTCTENGLKQTTKASTTI